MDWSTDDEVAEDTRQLSTIKTSIRKVRKPNANGESKSVLSKLYVWLADGTLSDKQENDWSEAEYKSETDELKSLKEESKDHSAKTKQDKSGLCPKCGKFVSDIRSHMKKHTNLFTCDLCFVNFRSERHLNEHKEVHESKDFHKCDICRLIFKDVTKLALHRYIHTRTYICPICGFRATSKFRNSIISHIKRHEDNYAVRCDRCNKGFFSKKKLEEHIEWHENIPKYQCQICFKKFPVKSYLTLHNKFNHKKELYGTEEIFQCELCGRKFTFEKSFKRHLSCIHKIGKDFTVKCPVCHKLIANNHNLKKHMKVHTGEKNFSCDVCGKTFSQRQYVTRHQRVHKEIKDEKPQFGVTCKEEDIVTVKEQLVSHEDQY
ncbi:hypothetical protein HUJ04_003597 [Dendroctonus ponderosae]